MLAVCSRRRAVGAAAAAAPAPTIEVPYTQFTLPNGLHVILHEDHSVPVVTVNIWYHVGSASERPGRTGFAHLFEHLMFMGSGHVKPGEFDTLLEAAGGDNNGSTDNDRTNYWINVPSNALELALFLESDRMGYLLDTMTPQTVDAQRDVVKNERRQSYENRPYGMAEIDARRDAVSARASVSLAGHRLHGGPHRGELRRRGRVLQEVLRAGQRQPGGRRRHRHPATTRKLVEKWFGDVQAGRAGRADHHSRRGADRRAEEDDHRPRAAAAAVSSPG